VVDTGSADGTIQAAEAAGANVVHFCWCDDFAAARNRGIEAARGRWILTLDADETIAPDDHPALRAAARDGDDTCFLLTQRNYTNRRFHPEWRFVSGQYPEQERHVQGYVAAYQIRLFPNRPDLRYHGCIHEAVKDPDAAGLEKKHLEIPIHHYGHLRAGDVASRRWQLYSRLTRRKLETSPEDGDAHLQMATRLLEEGDQAAARSLLRDLVAHETRDEAVVARGCLLLGRLLRRTGENDDARAQFARALVKRPDWLFCWVEMISTLAATACWSEMARYLTQAQRLFPDEPLLWRLECRLLVATGKFATAAVRSQALADRCPGWDAAQQMARVCRQLESKIAQSRRGNNRRLADSVSA